MTSFNSREDTWQVSGQTFFDYVGDPAFQDMMRYANYTNTGLNSDKPSYNPLLDPRGAFLFTPPHCLKQSSIGWTSPIIAYIKSDSQVQKDVVAQLTALF